MSRPRDTGAADACPGALRLYQAADGPLARVRLPGGALTAAQLEALAEAAVRFASGALELTSRGNVQLRGVTDAAALARAVATAGLLPAPAHERIRNIVASPLSGRVGGLADVRPWVAALDRALGEEPELAGLPGRFLFSVDDGSADVSGMAADAGVHVLPDGVALLVAGRDTGVRLRPGEAVPALLSVARRFAAIRETAWRTAELPDPGVLVGGHAPAVPAGREFPPKARPPVGWIEQDGDPGPARVALGAAVPLGVLSARQAQFVAAVGAPVVITPWRSLLVCDLTAEVADTALRVLAPLGLVFDAGSRWLEVSACTGSPGCERSRADVRAEAARRAGSPGTGRVHYVGCERACGSPPQAPGTEVLVATGAGFLPLPRPRRGPAVG